MLPRSRKDREYQKFVADGSGNTAIRALLQGGVVPDPTTFESTVTFEDGINVSTITSLPTEDLNFISSTLVTNFRSGLNIFTTTGTQRFVIRSGASTGISQFELGGGSLSSFFFICDGTKNQAVMGVRDTYGRQVLLVDAPYFGRDFDLPDLGFPVFGTFTGDPNVDNTVYHLMFHDGTNAVRTTGKGSLQDFNGVKNDGYLKYPPVEFVLLNNSPTTVLTFPLPSNVNCTLRARLLAGLPANGKSCVGEVVANFKRAGAGAA